MEVETEYAWRVETEKLSSRTRRGKWFFPEEGRFLAVARFPLAGIACARGLRAATRFPLTALPRPRITLRSA